MKVHEEDARPTPGRTDSSLSALPFFMLTSANLSKAAWGSVNKDGTSCLIMSYEAGVVWLLSLITGLDTFTVTSFSQREAGSEKFPSLRSSS
jgi:tyrosyl-DNA phosphodiesterase-1